MWEATADANAVRSFINKSVKLIQIYVKKCGPINRQEVRQSANINSKIKNHKLRVKSKTKITIHINQGFQGSDKCQLSLTSQRG